jgi:cyclophilin family peptidyl-prolyl cis-trans isomerase
MMVIFYKIKREINMKNKLMILVVVMFLMVSISVAQAKPMVKVVTSMGDVVIELNSELAPNTVANFMKYVKDGHYDGTIFHRVMNNFMIQGGGFKTGMVQKKCKYKPIKNEAYNGLKNSVGTIAMARTNAPHSATAQFFINVNNNKNLNFKSKSGRGWGYAVFGKVIKGMDVVERLSELPSDDEDWPLNNIYIKAEIIN